MTVLKSASKAPKDGRWVFVYVPAGRYLSGRESVIVESYPGGVHVARWSAPGPGIKMSPLKQKLCRAYGGYWTSSPSAVNEKPIRGIPSHFADLELIVAVTRVQPAEWPDVPAGYSTSIFESLLT